MSTASFLNKGRAEFTTSAEFFQTELFANHQPEPVTETFPVGADTNLPQFSVVGLSGGNLVLADPGAGTPIPAIGITTAAIVTGSGGSGTVAIFRAGSFRKEALNWGTWFNTDARRIAAFRGAQTPSNIFVV